LFQDNVTFLRLLRLCMQTARKLVLGLNLIEKVLYIGSSVIRGLKSLFLVRFCLRRGILRLWIVFEIVDNMLIRVKHMIMAVKNRCYMLVLMNNLFILYFLLFLLFFLKLRVFSL